MKLTSTSMRAPWGPAGLVLALSLLAGPAALAQDPHAGHDMSKMGMQGADPHAHHAHPDKSAATKRKVLSVSPAATPMVRQDGSKTTLAAELEGNKPVILAFIYTSCTTVCPVTSQILSRTHALTATDTLYTQTLTAHEIALITAGSIQVTLTTS